MSGYRMQIAPGDLAEGVIPVEGEPRWDAINRKLGFWNFEAEAIDWLRIPGPGENENYVPSHEWDGTSLKFRLPDGSWGEEVNLLGGSVTSIELVQNISLGYTFTFTVTDQEGNTTDFAVETGPLPDNSPGYLTIETDSDEDVTGKAKFVRHVGSLTDDRILVLDNETTPGSTIRVTRTGTGSFNLSVNGLIDLTTNTWADATFDGEDWYLSATGNLTL